MDSILPDRWSIWNIANFAPGIPAALNIGVTLSFVLSFIGAQIHRYRRVSDAVQRQQTKWVVLGMAVALGGFIAFRLAPWPFAYPGLFKDLIYVSGAMLCLLILPLAIGFAVQRYRLWDIDLLIRRTLIYSMLSVTLLVIYLFLVVSLQVLVSGWMEGLPNYALAGTTLAVVPDIDTGSAYGDKWVISGFAGYKTAKFRIGAEYDFVNNYSWSNGKDYSGYSFFGGWTFYKNFDVLARWDHLQITTPSETNVLDYYIIGFQYEPVKMFTTSVNFRYLSENSLPFIYANFGLKF